MRVRLTILPTLLFLLVVAFGLFPSDALAKSDDNPARDEFSVRVVSSAPYQITGGDARLHIEVPRTVPLHQVEVWVNSVDQRSRFTVMPGTRTLTGVIDGLLIGANALKVKANGNGKGRSSPGVHDPDELPDYRPDLLRTTPVSLRLHDDDPGAGSTHSRRPGHGDQGVRHVQPPNVIGYSRNCSVPTQVVFKYRTTANKWKDYTPGKPRPDDMAKETPDGQDFIVRWERGTINRFIYSIAMRVRFDDDAKEWNPVWNKRLIYRFDVGVGIGHTQGSLGKLDNPSALYDVGLARGYAVVYSSGTRTATHYNLQLGGETALMVKERFIERYDVPLYTVGVGGSGGGIQQYIYAQNHPDLIDAAIPQYAYPDMVTQVVHIGDCELLEHYMDNDKLDGANPRWKTWSNRSLLEGLNASDTLPNPYTGGQLGLTECVNAWRGLTPLVFNRWYGEASNQGLFEPPSAFDEDKIEWTHFADLVNIVGQDEEEDDGRRYARRYWDNVGVQYGLQSVARGVSQISRRPSS